MMPPSQPNRQILLTPPGAAAIAVLRLLGPGVPGFLAGHFSRPVPPGRCVHGELRDEGVVLDDPLVVVGDGWAEIHLHGGPWIVQAVQELALRAGFAMVADPLEADATDGRTLLEREMLAALPLARTELAIKALLAQPQAWAGVDSAELPRIAADPALWHLLHPPRVVLAGIPNAGKSTLANALYAREHSLTADLPGTTRDWVGELADLDGLAVMLIDTPGVREGEDILEEQAIAAGRRVIAAADVVVLVLDPTQPWENQAPLLGGWPGQVLVNALSKADVAPAVGPWNDVPDLIRVAAPLGVGLDDLRHNICAKLDVWPFDPTRPRWWTLRQRRAVEAGEIP